MARLACGIISIFLVINTVNAQTWDPRMDFNSDGVVNHLDLLQFLNAWQSSAPDTGLDPGLIEQIVGSYTFVAEGISQSPEEADTVYGLVQIGQDASGVYAEFVPADNERFVLQSDPSGEFDFIGTNQENETISGKVTDQGIDVEVRLINQGIEEQYSFLLLSHESFVSDPSGVWVIEIEQQFNRETSVLENDILFVEFSGEVVPSGVSSYSIQDRTNPSVQLAQNAIAIGTTLVYNENDNEVGIFFQGDFLIGTQENDEGWSRIRGQRYFPQQEPSISGVWSIQITELTGSNAGETETIPGISITLSGNSLSILTPDGTQFEGEAYTGLFKVQQPSTEITFEIFGRAVSSNRIEGFAREDRPDEYIYSSIVMTR